MRAWQWTVLAPALLAAPSLAVATRLELKECLRLALDRSPAAQAASSTSLAARERVRAAEAAFLPTLSGHAEYGVSSGYDEAVTNGGSTAAVLRVQFPVLDGGQRRAELRVARAKFRSAEAAAEQRRADVAFAVRSAYLTALGASDEAAIHRHAADVLADYAGLLRNQEERGVVPRDDVLRAEVELENARDTGRSASARALTATRMLGALAGVDIGIDDLVRPEESPAEPLREPSIDTSPAFRDALAEAEAARREADAAASERRAKLTLDADAGFLGVRPEHAFPDDGGGEFLVGFTVPIYDGGAAAARIAAATAVAASAEANAAATRQSLEIDLARLGVEADRAREQIESWRRAAPRAEDAFQLMRARYFGGGNVRLLEVLDALRQSVDARVAAVRARLDYDLARAERDQLLGVIP
jgi:outer membrane protein TolC